jgi:hypothetical protein
MELSQISGNPYSDRQDNITVGFFLAANKSQLDHKIWTLKKRDNKEDREATKRRFKQEIWAEIQV